MALPSNITGDITSGFINYVDDDGEHTWLPGVMSFTADPTITDTKVSRPFLILPGSSDAVYDTIGLVEVEFRDAAPIVGYYLTVTLTSPAWTAFKDEFMNAVMPANYDSGLVTPDEIIPAGSTSDIGGEAFFSWLFPPHQCMCILNTLHCAGLTLAGLCGTDKHTAAIILGTAGGRVTGGIKAVAAQQNGLLGGWYSWH